MMKPLRSKPQRKRNPAQPQLLFDLMPDRVGPALAELKVHPPKGDQWSWELRWDGYRLAVHSEPTGVRILTWGGHNWTHRFPAIEQAARALGPATMIIDGEAVVLDDEGRPDFGLLQKSLGSSGKAAGRRASDAILYAFDLIYLDGHDLRSVEYRSPRHLLEDTLNGRDSAICLSETIDADANVLLEHVCGLEGIVGKHLAQPYGSGRTGDWVKVKFVQSEAFMVVGYEPSTASPGGFASLALAAYRSDQLVHVRNVGTGFKEAEMTKLRKTLDKLRWKRKQPPVPFVGKSDIVWVEPTVIAEIGFLAWTVDGKLRHASPRSLWERQEHADACRLNYQKFFSAVQLS
ncbi:non-homologous end-joining DNA ligase [Agrobacterium larrymoorei]|uniref:non-homologous end-joining DNA ligase n=1 Tax=Agrobacterium larrymoorei TaxID=160699 RepID=UPI0030C3A511